MLELFTWSEAYSVGIDRLDDQHKKFFAMLNDLYAAMCVGQGNEILRSTLAGIVDYAHTHFACEEAAMLRYGYPGYAHHKKQHRDFCDKAVELQGRLRLGEAAMTVEVMASMREWLIVHITSEDQDYGPYLMQHKAA